MSKKSFVIGSAVGALLGSAAAFLFAPTSGAKTRKELQKMASEISSRVAKELPTLKRWSKEAYESLVDTTVKEYQKGKKLADGAVKDVTKTLKSQWKDVEKKMKG